MAIVVFGADVQRHEQKAEDSSKVEFRRIWPLFDIAAFGGIQSNDHVLDSMSPNFAGG